VLVGVSALAALLLAWSFAEPFTLTISRAVVSSPDVPPGFDGARIVFVSDVHAGPYFGKMRVRRLVDRIGELKPDVLVLGGDYVGGRAGGGEAFYPEAQRLEAREAVLGVLGNHDAWESADEARAGLEAAGVLLLENDAVRIERGGDRIVVAGLEDLWTGSVDATAAIQDIAKDSFTVLVSHNPDAFATVLPEHRGAFDLALSGHTHAGQLTALGMVAPIVPSAFGQRYRTGWLEEEGVPILVSRGIGEVTVPMRFFAPPEVHVIELRRGPASVKTAPPRLIVP